MATQGQLQVEHANMKQSRAESWDIPGLGIGIGSTGGLG